MGGKGKERQRVMGEEVDGFGPPEKFGVTV